MNRRIFAAAFVLSAAMSLPSWSEPVTVELGGDTFISGSGPSAAVTAQRDVYMSGSSVTLTGSVAQDSHVAGFDVDVEAATRGDVQAAGATVTLRAPVGEDLQAVGFSVKTSSMAVTGGNAVLAGGTVTIEGPVRGALTAMGGQVTLNAEIGGDVRLTGNTLSFGPNAKIGGTLHYTAPEKISVPERVVAPDRVTFQQMDRSDVLREARTAWEDRAYPTKPSFVSIFSGFLVALAFLIVIGAIFLAFLPKQVSHLRKTIADRPGRTLLVGVIGLSMLFGLVPISAMTIVGLPFVPIALLAIVALWTLGYVLGAYSLTMRIWTAFRGDDNPSIGIRLLVLAFGITIAGILNFVPFLGWLVNFALVLLGIGAMTSAVFDRMLGNPGLALDVDMNPLENK